MAFSPDGQLVATGDALMDGTIVVWDVPTGRLLQSWRGGATVLHALAFHPDGKTLALAHSHSPIISLWDVATGRKLATLRGHEEGATQLAFSPDGSLLASSDQGGTVKLWDIPQQDRLERTLSGHRGLVARIAFSRDGRLLATGSLDRRQVDLRRFSFTLGPPMATDGAIRIWDVATGQERAVLPEPERGVFDLAFSPDGSRLLSSSGEGIARLWDVEGARLIQSTRGPASGLAVFSAEGPRIVCSGGEIQVWDATTGLPLVSYPGGSGFFSREEEIAFNWLAVHPDGRRLLTAEREGLKIWDVSAVPDSLVFDAGPGGVIEVAFSA